MNDKLLVITKIKKTIIRLDKILENYNRNENVLRDNIKEKMYALLEHAYMANTFDRGERSLYQKKMLVDVKMIDFYLTTSYHKKLISPKQYTSIGDHLLETFILIQGWIKSEKA